MSTYLKNMAGYKHNQLKSKSYDEIQKLFDKEMNKVNTFVDMNSEVVKGSETRTEESSKRAGDELEFDKSKRKKIGEGSEPAEESKDELSQEQLQQLMIIVPKEWMNVELKRLFEPDDDDTLCKLQRYMHDPLKWKLYYICVVHHVTTERGHDIFMLVEKDYPLTRALMTLMLSNKLQVDEY
ncbi:hypothetical protein Tco_0216770 [Tanacetum coccineum]